MEDDWRAVALPYFFGMIPSDQLDLRESEK